MLALKKIAITGGLSCGKSSACHFFKELGSYTVSADQIVHQLLSSDEKLIQKAIDLLGSEIIVNGKIDRSKIAKKVFNDRQLLHSFEKLLHPAVYAEIEKQVQIAKNEKKAGLFIAEIPLLYETNGEKYFDKVILVTSDSEKCKQRFRIKTGESDTDYEKRNDRFLKEEEKALKADFILVNNGTLHDLQENITKIYHNLLKQP